VIHAYDIPSVRFRRPGLGTWLVLVIGTAIGAWRRADLYLAFQRAHLLMGTLAVLFTLTLIQLAIAMLERPYTVTAAQQARVDRLKVAVNIPVYNEDPLILDRALYAMFTQTRLPERVEVVDDGSTRDYSEVRAYWQQHHPSAVQFSWIRQPNLGKKRAQARTFATADADIFVTLDSDTALERTALSEGLKPFADRRVQSVAGVELAWNHRTNWLTRLNSTRSLIWQMLSCSAQSVAGDILVNRGTFALYRAAVIRDNVRAYVNETFFGRPVDLGDDAALTLFARARGKAVQQPSAIQFAMYPDTLSHHFRQWTRWMRGSTIRTFWRIRYLRILSYSWWFTVINLWTYAAATATVIVCVALWPQSRIFAATTAAASIGWSYAMAVRMFAIIRSDQSWMGRVVSFAIAPAVAAWSALVLRPLRMYGIATCMHQKWVTRHTVEVGPDADQRRAAARLQQLKEERSWA
jgi:hyaluronan synthase